MVLLRLKKYISYMQKRESVGRWKELMKERLAQWKKQGVGNLDLNSVASFGIYCMIFGESLRFYEPQLLYQ